MNNNDIYSVDYTRLLPPPLQNDPEMLAFAEVAAEELRAVAEKIHLNIIYARIDELGEDVLDILAYDFHVDWYDFDYPVEVKRSVLKDSIAVHRRLGTKYAVETALGNVYPGTRVEEWFEYGGDPFTFRIIIGATGAGVSAERQNAVLERVKHYKNLRSHLESISYKVDFDTLVKVGSFHSIGQQVDVYPFMQHEIESHGASLWSGYQQITQSIEVFPFLTLEIASAGGPRWGGYQQITQSIQVYPFENEV